MCMCMLAGWLAGYLYLLETVSRIAGGRSWPGRVMDLGGDDPSDLQGVEVGFRSSRDPRLLQCQCQYEYEYSLQAEQRRKSKEQEPRDAAVSNSIPFNPIHSYPVSSNPYAPNVLPTTTAICD